MTPRLDAAAPMFANPTSAPALPVQLEVWSNRPHLQQWFTALRRLHRSGEIRLRQQFGSAPVPDYEQHGAHLRDAEQVHCRCILGDGRRLYLDFHDSHEVCLSGMAWCDAYFKRSARAEDLKRYPKLRALGLNYPVHDDASDTLLLRRGLHFEPAQWRWHTAALLRLDRLFPDRFILPRLAQCEQAPEPGGYRTVLFQTRLWDPAEAPSADKAAAWARLNAYRIECVRRLRDALPEAFLGGIAPSAFARSQCEERLLCPPDAARRAAYMGLLRQRSIAVSTAGLHDSNGWKLAEYLAFGKPVLAEPPQHVIPGGFAAGRHYLGFDSADALVAQATRLLDDAAEADTMAAANHAYYRAHLHPDVLARRVLGLLDDDPQAETPSSASATSGCPRNSRGLAVLP
ncbi:glycosyltransferase [Aquimonas sp.]|jgi:hypothetical protein|uniref:glycosyltransferase n=1 Tax=Aquimonas sp. TaxID=1872588 RepID=UPI0037BF3B98